MALSEDEILEICIAAFARQPKLAALPVGQSSYAGQRARALSQLLAQVLASAEQYQRDSLPVVTYVDGVPTTQTSSAALENWAYTIGVPSNLGGYGRNGAVPATGGTATGTGSVPGTPISSGAVLSDPSGQVLLQLRTGVVVNGSGNISIVVDAVTTGSAGNLAVGTRLKWQSPPVGIAPYVYMTGATSGGYDVESDIALAQRILDYLRYPVQGGTPADIRRWAEESTDSEGRSIGVVRAYALPLRDGLGTCGVVALLAGSGSGRDPGATKAAQIQTYIDGKRIATDTITVYRPYMPSGEKLSIVIYIRPGSAFTWDWWYTNLPTAVVSAASTTLVLNAVTPFTLAAAVDAGKKPRIQLVGATPVPQVVRVLSYVDNSPAPGQATLTVDTAISGTPTEMYQAGGAVLPVALAVQNYIDSVGPSRLAGYLDPSDSWVDVVSVAGICQAALNATASDGRRVLDVVPNAGADPSSVLGVTIAVGAGTPATADVQMLDATPGQGPQIPELASVIILGG